jgi:hypothetical protein
MTLSHSSPDSDAIGRYSLTNRHDPREVEIAVTNPRIWRGVQPTKGSSSVVVDVTGCHQNTAVC